MKDCRYFLKIKKFSVGIAISLLITGNVIAVNTHIQTDGTLSGVTELNINTPGASHLYTLSEINGKLSGHNLFYSFSNFSIGTTDTAWFNLSTADLANVISRVTGGAESIIDGQLKMTNVGNAPSFFFINPAGITFNSGASVDVPGSFYVSTASHLKFSDGIQYAANETNTSSLSSANPESFGFLGDEGGSINIGDTNPISFTFKPGATVVFAGNDIHIDNTVIRNEAFTKDAVIGNEAFSKAGLDLQFFATGKKTMDLKSGMPVEKVTIGDLYITNSFLDPSGNGSGRIITSSGNLFSSSSDFWVVNTANLSMGNDQGINLYADLINLQQTNLFSYAIATGNGPNINVATNLMTANNNTTIVSETAANGASGDILINAKSLEINKSNISNTTSGGGDTGNIAIKTDSLLMNDSSGIVLFTSTNGNVGALAIDSKLVALDKGFIVSKTNGNGKAGDININTDLLKMSYSGDIDPEFKNAIDAGTFSNGDGGNVTVNADQIEMTHGFIGTSTGGKDFAGNIIGGEGAAGNVFLKANSLVLTDAAIVSNTLSQGEGGFVSIEIKNDLRMIDSDITSDTLSEGNAGSVNLSANTMWVDNGSRVSSSTLNSGNAGQISINANELTITSSATIQNETFEKGNAGSISISANALYLQNQGTISSSSRELAEGNGGEITVDAKHVEINNGAILNAALNKGNAGNITIQSDALKLNNKGLITTSTLQDAIGNGGIINIHANDLEINDGNIVTTTFGAGKAGHVFIASHFLRLTGGSIESAAREDSNGRAGNIRIDFSESLLLNPFSISTEAINSSGGDITIQGDGLVFLLNSAITTSVSGQFGNGGDIAIAAKGLILDSGFIQANTAASGASGGEVDIQTPALIPSGSSLFVGGNIPLQFQPFSGLNVIQAAAPDGISGTINAVAPQLNLNAMMTNLMIESFDSNALNRDMCSISDSSSLMQSGRGAQPLRARDLLLPMF